MPHHKVNQINERIRQCKLKALKKEIVEDCKFMIRRTNIVKMAILPKGTYRCNAIPPKFQ
jgi:hypothetical protein